ncbi:MAG: class I SAM-dependent methyltransferase [Thermoflexales bacterium]|nr:class I SAM-dependent methyltransferase [Thermoflexales bacterium]
MNLSDIVSRQIPSPWAEGDKIPWNEPGFSQRMLEEHLSQAHDQASRRLDKIDAHVAWIHTALLAGRPTRILDLGCGPGLYASRLARLGHTCVGIDFSPASITYALETAQAERLACTYVQQDIRTADYGGGFGLVMFVFGEFNPFRPADAEHILRKAFDALADDGILLLEVSTFEAVKRDGKQAPIWFSAPSSLFSAQPHVCLVENFWDAASSVATNRYFVIDAATGGVRRMICCTQAYTDEQYRAMLAGCGFGAITFYPALTGAEDETQRDLFVIVARKSR